MNTVFNTHHGGSSSNRYDGYDGGKRSLTLHPGSLYNMALYEFESSQAQQQADLQLKRPGHFYPVDEYKDLSLREILDFSDDFLFEGGESEPYRPLPLHNDASPNHPNHVVALDAPIVASNFVENTPEQVVVDNSMNSIELSPKKRRRQCDEEESDEASAARRFRPYQAGQWSDKFAELCEYREKTGHCLVPHTFSENLPLARWVKRQRYQFKLMRDGKSSTMTEERVQALEEIGFVWDSQGAAWGERLAELKAFRAEFLHCNVPSNFADNPQLATWVKCQRRQYKLHMEGKASNMTPQRIRELESLGFEWELRSYKKARTC